MQRTLGYTTADSATAADFTTSAAADSAASAQDSAAAVAGVVGAVVQGVDAAALSARPAAQTKLLNKIAVIHKTAVARIY